MGYRLTLAAYCGMGQTVKEGTLEEVRASAARVIRWHLRTLEYPVSVINRGREWELQGDPDGGHLISDHEGILHVEVTCDTCNRVIADAEFGERICGTCVDAADEADAEWDHGPTCETCGAIHDVQDYGEGMLCPDCQEEINNSYEGCPPGEEDEGYE